MFDRKIKKFNCVIYIYIYIYIYIIILKLSNTVNQYILFGITKLVP
ncbi:MAG: hypothetical protein N7Q72_00265 [Spiroplasma sp. Tabriz.8]|nr:hypothetical protein [Spiroplasma sp. Tabriz.8]